MKSHAPRYPWRLLDQQRQEGAFGLPQLEAPGQSQRQPGLSPVPELDAPLAGLQVRPWTRFGVPFEWFRSRATNRKAPGVLVDMTTDVPVEGSPGCRLVVICAW